MSSASLISYVTYGCAILVILAAATDLRRRRIPNYITLPAIAGGFFVHVTFGGWDGLLLPASGMLLAPAILSFAHAGRGPGMGDMKLAAGVGALLGPPLAAAAMLLSILAGGVMAVYVILDSGRFARAISRPAPGSKLPLKTAYAAADTDRGYVAVATIPYGVAIAFGTLLSLVVCRWTGAEKWFFLLGIVGVTR